MIPTITTRRRARKNSARPSCIHLGAGVGWTRAGRCCLTGDNFGSLSVVELRGGASGTVTDLGAVCSCLRTSLCFLFDSSSLENVAKYELIEVCLRRLYRGSLTVSSFLCFGVEVVTGVSVTSVAGVLRDLRGMLL